MKTKKELKDEYKLMTFPMGVFQIRNTENNMVLVDYSIDMLSKWNRHKMELKFGNNRNIGLQTDWNKFGEEKFVFEVLSELKPKDEENINFNKELKTLHEMIIEEINTETIYK